MGPTPKTTAIESSQTMTSTPTRHLDLGCGPVPRNPHHRDELYGVDIAPRHAPGQYTIMQGNLSVDAIPFPDNHFDSVSAFDFFEHVPRVLPTANGQGTRFPFIELMNEVSRVLRPGGLLYAITPCYPAREAFQDPTHVNIISEKTHLYFTGPQPLGRMYGFAGNFEVRCVDWVVTRDALVPGQALSLRQRWRRFNYRRKAQLSHLRWDFICNKPA
jgi:SAM-dependent methyltransferase